MREISRETGFSRVKTHKALLRLLVSAEKYYNANRITLAGLIKTVLVSKPAVAEEHEQTSQGSDEN